MYLLFSQVLPGLFFKWVDLNRLSIIGLSSKMSHVTDREDTRPLFRDRVLDRGLKQFGPDNLFKPYLNPISGAPEKGFS